MGVITCLVRYCTTSKGAVCDLIILLKLPKHNSSEESKYHECMEVNREALQLCAVYNKPYINYKSRNNTYQVLQVTCAASECAMKLKVCISP